jgi:transcriptional regulator with XRE-family HTH domain
MSSEAFRKWLIEELDRRKWSHGELSRQSGISRPYISQVLSDDARASVSFCHKIAHALGEPPEKVLRLAGILPSSSASEDDPALAELRDLVQNLPPEQRQEALRYLRYLYQTGKKDQ